MADFSDAETEWAPMQGFDGLPIPGVPPAAQPQALQRPAPPQLPPAPDPRHAPGPIIDRPAVERSPYNYAIEPGLPLAAQSGYGADVATVPATPPETSHSLGLTLLLVAVGGGVGLKLGGGMGGVAGTLYGGALANAIRAARCVTHGTGDGDKEALRSSTWALVGAGIASYLVYRESQKKKPARRNADEDETETDPEPNADSESDADDEPEDEPESESDSESDSDGEETDE
jgi:hypothetical protein